jgi:hypothetical protein
VVNWNVGLKTFDSKVLENGLIISHTNGEILIQPEDAEIFYRNLNLSSISDLPDNF